MRYLPLFMDLKGRETLVVGGGAVAGRKIDLLVRAGASITVLAPELAPEVAALVKDGRLRHIASRYAPGHMDKVHLVIAACDEREANEAVAREAMQLRLPVNVVDSPDLSSCIMPSIIDRSPVVVAVSTGGAAPVLARILRGKLESFLPQGLGLLAQASARFRDRVKARFATQKERRRYWEAALSGAAVEHANAGRTDEVEAELARSLDNPQGQSATIVHVLVVHSQRPDLATLRAMQAMGAADCLVLSPGIAADLADLARRDADRAALEPGLASAEIARHLAEHAAGLSRIVWLVRAGDADAAGVAKILQQQGFVADVMAATAGENPPV